MDARYNSSDVLSLKEIVRLEEVIRRHSQSLAALEEPTDVFHLHEGHLQVGGVYLRHCVRLYHIQHPNYIG